MENYLDLGDVSNFRDTDVVMRLTAKGVSNAGRFYTDQNGFQMQRRQLMTDLGVRANIYPVTNMAYIEDTSTRMSLVVDHAAAATSLSDGSLEVVMDRRDMTTAGAWEKVSRTTRTLFTSTGSSLRLVRQQQRRRRSLSAPLPNWHHSLTVV